MKEDRNVKILARNIRKTFGTGKSHHLVVLDSVCLEVRENEFLAIVGPSGCGKSTFLYIVAGFINADGGEVLINGKPISKPGSDRGIVFQHFALFPWRTVKGNIMYGLEEKGLSKKERDEIANQYIELVHLKGFEDYYPNQLSGGMKQRVAIARTLAIDPDVLLMDEPFGALDAQTRSLMQDELLSIWSIKKKTVLFVTHDVREAVYLADRVAIMTSIPGRIKAIVDTKVKPLGYGTTFETEEFIEKTNEVWRLVREEVDKSLSLSK